MVNWVFVYLLLYLVQKYSTLREIKVCTKFCAQTKDMFIYMYIYFYYVHLKEIRITQGIFASLGIIGFNNHIIEVKKSHGI